MAIEIVDFPIKHGYFPIKNGDFPIKNGDFPINNGDFPIKNGDFPITNHPLKTAIGKSSRRIARYRVRIPSREGEAVWCGGCCPHLSRDNKNSRSHWENHG